MAHDVFISYSSIDKPTADAIVASLEANGVRCWIAPRDILPGSDWSESIVEAMEQAGAMVLVFSGHSNTSPQIRREIESAVSAGIPVLPFRIEDVLPSKSLQYFIGPQHWLDAWTPPLEQHLHRLTATIQALLSKRIEGFDAAGKEPQLKPQTQTVGAAPTAVAGEPPPTAAGAETPVATAPGPPVSKFARTMFLILAGFVLAATFGGGAVWWLTHRSAAPHMAQAPAPPPKEGERKAEQPKAQAKSSVKEMTAEDYFNKGQAAKDLHEKILFYNKAIELNHKYAEAFNYRGNAYFNLKNYEMALKDYNTAISSNKNYANPYNNRAKYYLDVERKYDLALQGFDTAIKLSPKDAIFYSNRGFLYNMLHKSDAALIDYNKAIELDQSFPGVYNNRGNIYFKRKEYNKALQDFTKAIELKPDNPEAYYNRGLVYLRKKDYRKALQDFNKAIELNHNFALAYRTRGILHEFNKEYYKAMQDYNKAIELNPNMSDVYSKRKNLQKRMATPPPPQPRKKLSVISLELGKGGW